MFLQIFQPCRVSQDLGNSSNPIATSLNGPPGRSRAQISIDDLRKTELPELLGDCVRDFCFWHFSDLPKRSDDVRSLGKAEQAIERAEVRV